MVIDLKATIDEAVSEMLIMDDVQETFKDLLIDSTTKIDNAETIKYLFIDALYTQLKEDRR